MSVNVGLVPPKGLTRAATALAALALTTVFSIAPALARQTHTVDSACSLVATRQVVAVEELRRVIESLLEREQDERTRYEIARAYVCLAKGYLVVGPTKGETERLAEYMRDQLAEIYLKRAIGFDSRIEPESDIAQLAPTKRELVRQVVDQARAELVKADAIRAAEDEEERQLLERLRQAEEQLREAQQRVTDQGAEIDRLIQERRTPFTVSVGAAVAMPKVRDRDGDARVLMAILSFIGVELPPSGSGPRFSVGIAQGVGVAENTPPAFVIGFAGRMELKRLGLFAGYGWRLSTLDRPRQHDGVAIGFTVRLWRLNLSG